MKWISVEDDLPSYGDMVLVRVEWRMGPGYPSECRRWMGIRCCRKGWINAMKESDGMSGMVTHWMNLPSTDL